MLLCLSILLPAQEPACRRHTVLANVVDRDGFPLSGLRAEDFRGEFRGKPVRILAATIDERPKRIVVLLDASGSMVYQEGKWMLALQAARDIFGTAPPDNSVALLVFGSKIDTKIDFAQGRAAAIQELQSLETGRKAFGKGERRTALLDTILEGIGLLSPPQPGDVIYIITDGGENRSRNKVRKVERAMVSGGVRLYGLLLSPVSGSVFPPSPVEELEGPSLLRDLTETTGGSLLYVTGNPNRAWFGFGEKKGPLLARLFRWALPQMAKVYQLDIELPQPVDKPRYWKLELVERPGIGKKELILTYQRKLIPCPAPTASSPGR
jgi:hypothetical protein